MIKTRADAEAAVELAQQSGDGRLAGSWIADEDDVPTRLDHGQIVVGAQLLDPEQARESTHLALDVFEADQLVELGEHVLDGSFGRQLRDRLGSRRRRADARGGHGRSAWSRDAVRVHRREEGRPKSIDRGDLVG